MRNRLLAELATALCLVTSLTAQTSPPKLAFEVASIKPAPPLGPAKIVAGKLHIGMSVDAARVDIGNLSLADLVRIAFKVKPYQVSGPDWMSAERFDVLAKMPEGTTKEQVPEMLQTLLAERFKLAMHRDSKEHSVYALVVGKNGHKMKEVPPEESTAPVATDPAAPPKPGGIVVGTAEGQMKVNPSSDGKGATIAGGPFGQMKMSMGEAGMMRMEFAKLSMPGLAEILARFADRPVVDMTGLKGNYQVALELSMEEMKQVARAQASSMGIALPGPGGVGEGSRSPADAASTPTGTSVLGAVQQLGLRLEPRKSPVEMVVIDHIEKAPTEN